MFVKISGRLAKIAGLPRRWRLLIVGASVFVLLVFLFPFKSTTVPRWRLNVVDQSGVAGIPNIRVTEHWQHYLLESGGHEEVLKTDANGVVSFPERTVRGSIAARLWGTIANFAGRGFNAKYDPYASVVVWGDQNYETAVAVYHPETPQTEIVVHRVP